MRLHLSWLGIAHFWHHSIWSGEPLVQQPPQVRVVQEAIQRLAANRFFVWCLSHV